MLVYGQCVHLLGTEPGVMVPATCPPGAASSVAALLRQVNAGIAGGGVFGGVDDDVADGVHLPQLPSLGQRIGGRSGRGRGRRRSQVADQRIGVDRAAIVSDDQRIAACDGLAFH